MALFSHFISLSLDQSQQKLKRVFFSLVWLFGICLGVRPRRPVDPLALRARRTFFFFFSFLLLLFLLLSRQGRLARWQARQGKARQGRAKTNRNSNSNSNNNTSKKREMKEIFSELVQI